MEPDDLADAYESAYAAGKIDGYNEGRTDRHMPEDSSLLTTFRSINLDVAGDGATVVVDTSALAGPHGVRRLLVEREAADSDVWHHYPSGVSGSLSEVLVGIAWSYVRQPDTTP